MLEPGGRIAVNVANLGRKPYRSLSADVIRILQDEPRSAPARRGHLAQGRGGQRQLRLGFVPQRLQPGAARPHRTHRHRRQGPVRPGRRRARIARPAGLPVRELGQQRRVHGRHPRRVGHPPRERQAGRPPGPVPGRAARAADPPLHLSRTTSSSIPSWARAPSLLAAAKLRRRYVGYDLDPTYVAIADNAWPQRAGRSTLGEPRPTAGVHRDRRGRPGRSPAADPNDDFQARAVARGQGGPGDRQGRARAGRVPDRPGATSEPAAWASTINLVALDALGKPWNFDVTGAFTDHPRRPAAHRLGVEVAGKAIGAGQQRLRVATRPWGRSYC